ncbi:MAG: quinate 5-dehydrogenase [Firmicutes bacterium]|nr:quinate 5-dehydrogenase [Bacillota bacterium]
MRRVVSISLGSSERNHTVETEILGERFRIERIGTDGSKERAIALIRELDGKVDAFGMGGTDLYVWAGRKRLVLRDSLPLAQAARKTPIVDGSGLKNTLERRVVEYLDQAGVLPLRGMKALMVSGVDRFGMAEALLAAGARVTFGDLAFLVGLPVPIRSLGLLELLGRTIGPIIAAMPIDWLYPTGEKQRQNTPRYGRFFAAHELIAGDFHLIRRYMPPRLDGKVVLTNTVTRKDVEELRRRGVRLLITTTPELQGRSFGTNVMEAVLVALSGKRPEELTPADYNELLDRIGFRPRIEPLADAPITASV